MANGTSTAAQHNATNHLRAIHPRRKLDDSMRSL
jgi:hypothetical protein